MRSSFQVDVDVIGALKYGRAARMRALQRAIGAAQDTGKLDERAFRHAVFLGYPDRVGRRQPGSPRLLLASGHGGVVSPESAEGTTWTVSDTSVAGRSMDSDGDLADAEALVSPSGPPPRPAWRVSRG